MTPLVRKLGLRPGQRVAFVEAPAHYAALLAPLPDGLLDADIPDGDLDFVQYFAPSETALRAQWPVLKACLASTGMLWICWPKKTSTLSTDLSRETVRQIGLDGGLVDVKVCAIDADWSGLKFVYRTKDR